MSKRHRAAERQKRRKRHGFNPDGTHRNKYDDMAGKRGEKEKRKGKPKKGSKTFDPVNDPSPPVGRTTGAWYRTNARPSGGVTNRGGRTHQSHQPHYPGPISSYSDEMLRANLDRARERDEARQKLLDKRSALIARISAGEVELFPCQKSQEKTTVDSVLYADLTTNKYLVVAREIPFLLRNRCGSLAEVGYDNLESLLLDQLLLNSLLWNAFETEDALKGVRDYLNHHMQIDAVQIYSPEWLQGRVLNIEHLFFGLSRDFLGTEYSRAAVLMRARIEDDFKNLQPDTEGRPKPTYMVYFDPEKQLALIVSKDIPHQLHNLGDRTHNVAGYQGLLLRQVKQEELTGLGIPAERIADTATIDSSYQPRDGQHILTSAITATHHSGDYGLKRVLERRIEADLGSTWSTSTRPPPRSPRASTWGFL